MYLRKIYISITILKILTKIKFIEMTCNEKKQQEQKFNLWQ